MTHVTVVTPTYNRSENLKKLYASLTEQINKNFIWLIIDDGSSDRTAALAAHWMNEAMFPVIYKKKQNGGKHTALNFAYQYIDTELTFIVDSDDWLLTNAIEIIEQRYHQFKHESDLCGLSFLKGKPGGGYLSSKVSEDGIKDTYCEARINKNISGDMAEVWYTRCLNEYPFPEFENEKFLGEDIVWVKMSGKYKMRFFNDVIYIADYLPDGLTKNRRKHNLQSPNGCVARAKVFLEANITLRWKIKAMLQYQIYGRFAQINYYHLLEQSGYKVLFIILTPAAVILYYKWKAATLPD